MAGELAPDFFISYALADSAWAKWIEWVLEEDRYRVLIQAWDLAPGSHGVPGMRDGMKKAARTIAVLSADYLKSVYGAPEWQAAWTADPGGSQRKLLAVRVADCDRPGPLGRVARLDLFGLSEPQAMTDLLSMAASAGRAKPAAWPEFPGGRAMTDELDRASEVSPAAAQLLAVCAYLDPDSIPLALFSAHPRLLPQPLSSDAADMSGLSSFGLPAVIAALVHYALAERTADGLRVHRLVQAAVRARHEQEKHPAPDHPLAVVLRLLCAYDFDQGKFAPSWTPQWWDRWDILLPHTLAAARHIDRLGWWDEDFVKTEDTALLLHSAANAAERWRWPGEERPLRERTLAINEAIYGPDHESVVGSLYHLAVILERLGEPEQARPLLERALAIHEAAYGPDHRDVADDLRRLARNLRQSGQPEQARPLLERALAIHEAAYGPDHRDVADDLRRLGRNLRQSGQPEQARPLLERALAIARAQDNADDPEPARYMNELALILRDLGNLEEARSLQARAQARDPVVCGPEDII